MPRKSTTRAAAGAGTIRQRSDKRWEARYTIGRDPGTGKQVQRSIYGASQQEVRKRLQEISVQIEQGTYVTPSRMTVGQWLEVWQQDYLGGIKPNSQKLYAQQIRLYLMPALGAVKLTDLSPHMIQRTYNSLLKPHTIVTTAKTKDAKPIKKERPGISPKSLKNIHGIFHHSLKQAVRLGYLKSNPADAVMLPRCERKEIHFIDDEYIPLLLEAIKGNRYENPIRFALFTGLREGEIIGLRWDAVDFSSGAITISRQLQRDREKGGQFHFVSLKNDRTRKIQAPPFVLDILKEERRRQNENRLHLGKAWQNEWGLVFVNELGEFIRPNALYRAFKKVCVDIGIPQTRFHDLRHTYATLALQNGDDIKTVQEAVGHATASFTLDVYGHVSQRMKQESANRMQAYYDGLQATK